MTRGHGSGPPDISAATACARPRAAEAPPSPPSRPARPRRACPDPSRTATCVSARVSRIWRRLWAATCSLGGLIFRMRAYRAANAPEAPLDAVIVPGGGLDERGEPWPWVKARLDAALRHDSDDAAQYLVLSRGTTHKPAPTDADGFAVDESVASARYLIARGVDPRRIVQDAERRHDRQRRVRAADARRPRRLEANARRHLGQPPGAHARDLRVGVRAAAARRRRARALVRGRRRSRVHRRPAREPTPEGGARAGAAEGDGRRRPRPLPAPTPFCSASTRRTPPPLPRVAPPASEREDQPGPTNF